MQLHKWSKNVVNVKNCQYLKGNCQFFSVMSEMKTVFFYNSSLVLFTACFYHFLFWRYLNSSMTSFSSDILLPSISKFKWFEQPRQRPPITPSNNLENKILSDIYWRVQLVCIKLQTCSSLEQTLKYNQGQIRCLFDESRFAMTFLIIFELQKYYVVSD